MEPQRELRTFVALAATLALGADAVRGLVLEPLGDFYSAQGPAAAACLAACWALLLAFRGAVRRGVEFVLVEVISLVTMLLKRLEAGLCRALPDGVVKRTGAAALKFLRSLLTENSTVLSGIMLAFLAVSVYLPMGVFVTLKTGYDLATAKEKLDQKTLFMPDDLASGGPPTPEVFAVRSNMFNSFISFNSKLEKVKIDKN